MFAAIHIGHLKGVTNHVKPQLIRGRLARKPWCFFRGMILQVVVKCRYNLLGTPEKSRVKFHPDETHL